MKKILGSVGVLAVVGALVLGATGAFFSDTETSTGNTFTAGAIDLTVDSTQHYNNAICTDGHWVVAEPTTNQYPVAGSACDGTWTATDLGAAHQFFDFADIKPGDSGENTVSLHINNNDAWLRLVIRDITNNDNGLTEPESKVDTTDGDGNGELRQNLLFTVFTDADCNNIKDGNDVELISAGPIDPQGETWALPTPVPGGQTVCFGITWNLPPTTGNETQTDSMSATMEFQVEQARNNPNPFGQTPVVHQLVLDNEVMVGDPWTTTPGDQIGGVLTWAGDGPTFNYSVTASGLPASTNYSLIYYADPYPGNNPGALIGTGTTDVSGNLAFSGNPDLGMDLPTSPDANIAAHNGAKIWLIPSANYDAGTKSVTPWTPDNTWLFEGNVYINYNDTNN